MANPASIGTTGFTALSAAADRIVVGLSDGSNWNVKYSTDGESWTAATSATTSAQGDIDLATDGTNFLAVKGYAAAASYVVRCNLFTWSTKTWGTQNLVHTPANGVGGPIPKVARRSSDYVIVHEDDAERVMGTYYTRIAASYGTVSSWTKVSSGINAGNSNNAALESVLVAPGGRCHVGFTDSSGNAFKQFGTGNTWEASNDGGTAPGSTELTYFSGAYGAVTYSSTDYIVKGTITSASGNVGQRGTSTTPASVGWASATLKASPGDYIVVAHDISEAVLRSFFTDTTANALEYRESTDGGSTWSGSDQTFATSTTLGHSVTSSALIRAVGWSISGADAWTVAYLSGSTYYSYTVTASTNQTLTQNTTFDDSTDTFYAATVTPGARALTQNTTFDDSTDTFYGPTANVSITLTAGLLDDSADTFYAASVSVGAANLLPSLLDDSTDTFYAASVSTGSVTLSPTLVDDSTDTFYAASITNGVTLTAGLLDDSTDTFYAASVSVGAVTLSPSLLDDSTDTFYAAAISQPAAPQTLTQNTTFDDSTDTFYSATVSASITVSPELYQNFAFSYSWASNILTVTASTIDLTSGRFGCWVNFGSGSDPEDGAWFDVAGTSGSQSISLPQAVLEVQLGPLADTDGIITVRAGYSLTDPTTTIYLLDASSFYVPTISTAIGLSPTLVDDSTDTFYAAEISQVGGPQTLTQSSTFDDSTDTFYAASVGTTITLTAGFVDDSTDTFYSATVSQAGSQTLTQDTRFDDSPDTFYAVTVTGGEQATPTGGGGGYARHYTRFMEDLPKSEKRKVNVLTRKKVELKKKIERNFAVEDELIRKWLNEIAEIDRKLNEIAMQNAAMANYIEQKRMAQEEMDVIIIAGSLL